jgi:outer membrane receptor protein involved in Fe transport
MTLVPDARTRSVILVRVASLLALAAPVAARAEPSCARPADVGVASRGWSAPLDRRVTVHGRGLALGDALDRVAAAARIRLSYSPDGLALDRLVCLAYDSVAAGEVLSDLLAGSALLPVPAGDDQVVLTPVAGLTSARSTEKSVKVLARVLVTSSALRVGERGVAAAVDVVTHSQLIHRGSGPISQTLNGAVPGMWVWDQSPSSVIAHYGSLRGASSFRASYPKVYIDGIELANPLLLTELSPDAVERIEVVRGPQGGALYGADAIGGVINVIMRHDPGGGDGVAQFRTTAGMTHSAFAQHPVLTQEHTLDLRTGNDTRSSSLSLALGTIGSYIPGAQSWDTRADGGFRMLGAHALLTGTARFYAKQAGLGPSPLIASPSVAASQSLREYTLGSTATFAAGERWTHVVTVGVDGYRLSGVAPPALSPVPSSIDSALLAARGSADRATLRASSVARFGTGDGAAATATFAAEQSILWQRTDGIGGLSLGDRRETEAASGSQRTTGAVGKLDVSWRDALFATGGVRVEHLAGLAVSDGLVTLPTLGATAVHGFGPVTAKLRTSYGRAIRSPESAVRASSLANGLTAPSRLAPEEQSGFEGGVDAFVGSAVALRVTRFDQHAYSLIQPVASASAPANPNNAFGSRLLYTLQNVGEIANRGWELESSVAAGHLTMTGTLSLVDSRVTRLAPGYAGDLRAGDRMLAVPARSAGLTSVWTAARWSASVTTTRVADWVNYDGIALAGASSVVCQPIVGEQLRDYWREYAGVTRIDASASRDLFHRFTFVVAGTNLLDIQRGEPDNVTVVPGRTISAGVKATF